MVCRLSGGEERFTYSLVIGLLAAPLTGHRGRSSAPHYGGKHVTYGGGCAQVYISSSKNAKDFEYISLNAQTT